MDIKTFLSQVVEKPGLPGHELPVATYIKEAFAPYVDTVEIDVMQNVIARKKGKRGGPRVMVTAHIDEIGLMVSRIESDGCLRFEQMGGVDPRILPAGEVWVRTDPPLFGVIGVMPPHLLTAADQKKNYQRKDLYIDVGLTEAEAREQIPIGTPVQLVGPYQELQEDRFCAKTLDDRACVAMLLLTAEQLAKVSHIADITFVLATQEEVGSRGATTAAYALKPDIGIAVDVTHGTMPGTGPDETYPLDKVVMSMGPNIHPKLFATMQEKAKEIKVDVATSVAPHTTWTDADPLQISRAGVPTALLELPLKYMHTTVELCALDTLKEGARLLAAYLGGLDEEWEETLCY